MRNYSRQIAEKIIKGNQNVRVESRQKALSESIKDGEYEIQDQEGKMNDLL